MDDLDIGITADIVSAYVSNNSVSYDDLPKLIAEIHLALSRLIKGPLAEDPVDAKLVPAVPIKKSVTADYIVSLEDGKKYKSLKRHLSTHYGLSPDEYRAKWGLPSVYPMVAPNYAKARSELAKQMGLGQARRNAPAKKAVKTR